MNLLVRPADLAADREVLVKALLQYLTPFSDHRRFRWLYEESPHGQAKVWVMIDPNTHEIVGSAAAFPRHIFGGGAKVSSWVLGDFWIGDDYRSLGPALQLQRACLGVLDGTEGTFCYDFPSQGMMAVYKRLRIEPFRHMIRLAKPLRVDRLVGKFVKSPAISPLLTRIGNFALRLSERKVKDKDTVISLHEGSCGEEFSQLAKEVGSQYGVCTQRSADYLNWRYLSHPVSRYELLTARQQGRLLAYAVFSHHEEDAALVDIFGIDEPVVMKALLWRLGVLLRARGVVTMSIAMLESHPWIALFSQAGFKRRDAYPVVLCQSARGKVFDNMNWFLLQGDRDS